MNQNKQVLELNINRLLNIVSSIDLNGDKYVINSLTAAYIYNLTDTKPTTYHIKVSRNFNKKLNNTHIKYCDKYLLKDDTTSIMYNNIKYYIVIPELCINEVVSEYIKKIDKKFDNNYYIIFENFFTKYIYNTQLLESLTDKQKVRNMIKILKSNYSNGLYNSYINKQSKNDIIKE